MEKIKSLSGKPLSILALELLVPVILSAIVFTFSRTAVAALNYELFGQAIVTLNSGIIIAIFIALFHSPNKNIEEFKKFKRAARQVYKIFLINCFLVAVVFLLVNNGIRTPILPNQQFINIFSFIFSISLTLVNIKLINDLLMISFKE